MWNLVGDRRSVASENVGKDHAVGQAVMGVMARPDGMGDRVDRSESFRKSGGPHGSRRKHISAGFKVPTILDRTRQISIDDLDSFERHTISERMKRPHAISLKAMGERVHSG